MASRKTKTAKMPVVALAQESEVINSYKGFDKDLRCRGFQFEIGKEYEHAGKIEICASGFHACEHPFDVFGYYPPASSRFAEVRQSGEIARHNEDTKIVSARIKVEVEISLTVMIERAVKWVFDRAKWVDGPIAKGPNEAATASGYQGAATASGDQGAATASGYHGAATASGYHGAATASGYQGAATASGYHGAATASGCQGAASAVEGCALFLVHRDDNDNIKHAWAGIVGQKGIKPNTFYRLDENGAPQEVGAP